MTAWRYYYSSSTREEERERRSGIYTTHSLVLRPDFHCCQTRFLLVRSVGPSFIKRDA